MESKKINQLATELAPDLSDLTIIGDPTTGISKKITLSQMASLFTGTVEEYANFAAFPLVGVADTIYIALDTNVIYRYDTSLSAYVILSPNIINSLVFSDANGFDGTITLVGSVATLSITTALTLGSVPFIGASGALIQDNANLFFDDTNNRLGIATALPTTPLDVFGSGIIGRLNATSTNNAYLGFASNGTNKWSAGNVQSDHRFRIFSEANSAELITILQTGEFGIGIANPLTKFHIDGGATALIANLDANISVAKSVSYRSDNSSRINLEVSGTESGSNAGADFFLRTFTDAGSLLETPFTIVRSTGVTTIKSLTLTNVLSVANGGTGSATQNFVDLTTTQSIGGAKTFTSALAGTSASFSSTATATAFIPSGATIPTNGMYLSAANTLNFATNSTNRFSISSTGAATFTSSLTITSGGFDTYIGGTYGNFINFGYAYDGDLDGYINFYGYNGASTRFRNLNISNGKGTTVAFFKGSTGSVGIGTNTPTSFGSTYSVLDLYNAVDGGFLLVRSPSVTGDFHADESVNNVNLGTRTNSNLVLRTNVTERMRITSGGITKKPYINYTEYHASTAYASQNGVISFGNSYNQAGLGDGLIAAYASTLNANPRLYMAVASNGVYLTLNATSWTANSDERLKNINGIIENALDKLCTLRAVNYSWKEDNTNKKYIGLIAQDVQKVLPEVVDINENDEMKTLGVRYTELIPVLIKAIQELKAEIDILKAK